MEPAARNGAAAQPAVLLFTVEEARLILRYSRSLIYELIRSGRLGSVKEGRARRIPAAAIADYVALLDHESKVA